MRVYYPLLSYRSESTSPSVGDMWRDSDQVDGGGVSHLTGYHPPQIRSPETTEPGSHSKQSITKKKGEPSQFVVSGKLQLLIRNYSSSAQMHIIVQSSFSSLSPSNTHF